MSTSDAIPPSGRPRDPAIDQAVLTATQDLLIEHGFSGTTVAAAARAAGSGKAAVYRRWPSKDALVVAAVRALHDPPQVPDTGSLREDLIACAVHYTRADDRATLVLASLLSEMGRDPELRAAAYEAIGGPAAAPFTAVMERWIDRGAIRPSAPLPLIAGIVPAVAFQGIVARGRGLDRDVAVALVDHVLLPALAA